MSFLEKQFMITIFILYSFPTILVSIFKFDFSILYVIIINCLLDCLLIPTIFYYILKDFISMKYLELSISKKFTEDKLKLYMHLYIIMVISISATISRLIYLFNPLDVYYLHHLTLFQIKVYILLATAGFIAISIMDRKY